MTPNPPAFTDLIEKYGASYGHEWITAVPAYIARLQTACETKNLTLLLDWLLPCHNQFAREVFERITDQRLPTTQTAMQEALEKWAGSEAVARYRAALASKLERRAEEQVRKARERLIQEVATWSIRYQGETLTVDVFIRRIIDEGYIRLEERRRGAVPIYYLWHTERNSGYDFRRRCEYDYIQELLAQRKAPPAKASLARNEGTLGDHSEQDGQ